MGKLRLTQKEINIIKSTAKEIFGENIKVYIFGSRTNPNKKGGDIDILIKTLNKVSVSQKLNFLAELELKGIERKVDLIVITPNTKLKEIHKEALKTGVEIW